MSIIFFLSKFGFYVTIMKKYNITSLDRNIAYKKVRSEDFPESQVEKIIIEPLNGYVDAPIVENIDIYKKETVIINASVGLGKTTGIIKLIEKYYKSKKYYIILAVPRKALVDHYITLIKKASNREDIIFDYRDLEAGKPLSAFDNCIDIPVQVFTVNSLVGNPGEKAVAQSKIKNDYLEKVINRARVKGRKVVLIFDEVHQAVHNFKDDHLLYLYKWHKVVNQIIISSATFTEGAITVSKKLSELTSKRIKILETERIQSDNENLSSLNLCFNNVYFYKVDDPFLNNLFLDVIPKTDNINILSFSKKFAEDLYESALGEAIADKFGALNLCTSSSKNPFDSNVNNLGTTFNTGNSIEKSDSTFVVIMPPNVENPTLQNDGIFTNGITEIIQAIARVRLKSHIYIVMPYPKKLILKDDNDQLLKSKASLYGRFDFSKKENIANYTCLTQQRALINSAHRQNFQKSADGVYFADKQIDSNKPIFTNLDNYIIEKGEKYLKKHYPSFGKNLSNYIYWAALTNQFVNCKLEKIYLPDKLYFDEMNVQQQLDKYLSKDFFEDSYFVLHSDVECFEKLRRSIFANIIFYRRHGETEWQVIDAYEILSFEQQLLIFIQRKRRLLNSELEGKFYETIPHPLKKFSTSKKIIGNIDMEKETYLRAAMLYATEIDGSSESFTEDEKLLIQNYSQLYNFKQKLLGYTFEGGGGKRAFPLLGKVDLKTEDRLELETIFNQLIKYDKNLSSFSFTKQSKKSLKTMLKITFDIFFKLSLTTTSINGEKQKANSFEDVDFPTKEEYVNFIYWKKRTN